MKYLVILLSLCTLNNSYAFPTLPKGAENISFEDLAPSKGYDFSGTVRLSGCSASLVKYDGEPNTNKAKILTNGHCLLDGMPGPGKVLSDMPSKRGIKILDSNANPIYSTNTTKLIVGLMTGTDIGLYELNETYDKLASLNVPAPLTLSSQVPQDGTAIEILSGYWSAGFSCAIEKTVYELHEDKWSFRHSVRYSDQGCSVYGGTSGSPIVRAGTNEIIAINNTGNEDGQKCTMNNPCEINEQGDVTVLQGRGYGQQTSLLYSCINENWQLDLKKEGCQLGKM